MSNKEILVLAEDYSDDKGKVSLHYIHTRNIEYIANGFNVTVISFSSNVNYELDGVRVISLDTYNKENIDYHQLISHAPNIRNHYYFLKKHINKFRNTILFFHGHEVLRMSEAYPEPYPFLEKPSRLRVVLRNLYDSFKFRKWASFIKKYNNFLTLVFVSDWMLNEFSKNLRISTSELNDYHIIHNSVGSYFEDNKYEISSEKKFDFITVRSFLDGKKYAIDVVEKLAILNPEKKFLVIGKGKYFDYNELPNNITLMKTHLSHTQIVELLNQSKYALLPTRTDSQGVMACEMITYGIPLITSNIPVCVEMFSDYQNVTLIDNDKPKLEIDDTYWERAVNMSRPTRFLRENTVLKEVELLKRDLL